LITANNLFYKNHFEDKHIGTFCCNLNGNDYIQLVLKLLLKWN